MAPNTAFEGWIYLIINLVNGKRYVGKTIRSISQRWTQHQSDARSKRYDTYLHKAIRKYGSTSFRVEPVARFEDSALLNTAEQIFIKELGTKSPEGYNLTDGGDGMTNPSDEARRKMRNAKIGFVPWNKGKTFSETARLNMSAAAKKPARLASLLKRNRSMELTPELHAKRSAAGMKGADARWGGRHRAKY